MEEINFIAVLFKNYNKDNIDTWYKWKKDEKITYNCLDMVVQSLTDKAYQVQLFIKGKLLHTFEVSNKKEFNDFGIKLQFIINNIKNPDNIYKHMCELKI